MQMTRVATLLTSAVLSGAVVVSGAQLAGASASTPAHLVAHSGPSAAKAAGVAETSAARAAAPRAKRLARKQRVGAGVADRKRAGYREVLADPKMTDLEGLGPQLEQAATQGLARVNQLAKSLRQTKSPQQATRIIERLRALDPGELREMGKVAVAALYAQEDPSAIRDVLELLEGSPLGEPLAGVIALIRDIVAKIDETPLGSVVRIVDTLLGGLTGLLKNLIGQLPLPALGAR